MLPREDATALLHISTVKQQFDQAGVLLWVKTVV